MKRLPACLFAASLLCAAVADGWPMQAHAAPTLRIGLQDDPDALDPAQSGTYAGREVFASLCDKLVDIDAGLNIVPQLATSWTWSDDALTLTLHLREDVSFHDGAPLDAEAVRANLERYRTAPESSRKAELKSIASIDVVDAHTVRLNLAQPFVPLLSVLSDRSGMMLSPKTFAGRDTAKNPVCSGPFKFAERVPQDHITLDRFAGYWNAKAINFDHVVFRPIADSSVRLVNLQSGQLDLIEEMAPSDAARVKANANLSFTGITSLGWQALTINLAHPPGNDSPLARDPRVREAFEAAIDRDIINKVALDGLFVPDNQSELPSSRFFDPAHPTPGRDVDRAKALLHAAGVDRLAVSLLLLNTPRDRQIGEILQVMLGEVGIDLSLRAVEVNTQIEALNRGDFQVGMTTWSGRADPDFNISIILAADGFQNWSKYASPRYNAFLTQSRAVAEPARRAAIYRQSVTEYLADRPAIFLFHPDWLFAMSAKLRGFTPLADGMIRPQGIMLAP